MEPGIPEAIEPSSSGQRVLYSETAIAGATFLGGPIAATYLIARNFRALGNMVFAKRTLIVGILLTLLAVPIAFLLPENNLVEVAAKGLHFLYAIPAYLVVRKFQRQEIKSHFAAGGAKGSPWKAAGIGLVSMAMLLAYGLLFTGLTMPPEKELRPLDAEVEMPYSRCIVLYDSTTISRLDARDVGRMLEKVGYFRPTRPGPEEALLYTNQGHCLITFPVPPQALHEPEVERTLRAALVSLENAHPGRQYKFRLLVLDKAGDIEAERFIEAKVSP